jgi:16S rRNA (cytosine1402-N4)-methyltransferase
LTAPLHQPAMAQECLAYLDICPSGVYADLTIGQAGHAELILEQLGPEGFLLGIDRDPLALAVAEQRLARFAGRFRLVRGRFSGLEQMLAEAGIEKLDGVLMDTGISRDQLLDPTRGFSFDSSGLSMKLDPDEPGPDAAEIVNTYSLAQLREVFSIVGKGREARRAARAIVAFREGKRAIASTAELADIIAAAVATPASWGKKRHPATVWIMAIRIAANDELAEIANGLRAAARSLRPGTGRLVVLTWAGHEHGLVRQTLRNLAQPCTCPPALPCNCGLRPVVKVLTRKPLSATEEEVRRNPAARTCRLQAAVAVAADAEPQH